MALLDSDQQFLSAISEIPHKQRHLVKIMNISCGYS